MEIGFPPEFGADGAAPPQATAPVELLSLTFVVAQSAASEPVLLGVGGARAAKGFAAAAALATSFVVPGLGPLLLGSLAARSKRAKSPAQGEEHDIRRLTHSRHWRRADLVQLPPGSSHEWQYTLTTGVTESQTRELGAALGIKAPTPAALSGSLSAKFSLQLSLTTQETRTKTLTLRNDSASKYQRYARWSIVDRLDIVSLEPLSRQPSYLQQLLAGDAAPARERRIFAVELLDSSSPNLTWAEADPA